MVRPETKTYTFVNVTPYRFYRLNVTDCNSSTLQVRTLAIYDGVDTSLVATMSASNAPRPLFADASSEYSTWYAWKAFDSTDDLTLWMANGATGWLRIDLGGFYTDWIPFLEDTEVISVAGVPQTRAVDYTPDHEKGIIIFIAGHEPGVGDAVTADYDVEFIPKDVNHVLDVSWNTEFTEA